MAEPSPLLAGLNRTIHEPARLAILAVLSGCENADFLFLERATGLTRGNLSVQLTRLEEAGLVSIDKVIQNKRTLTTIWLTATGRERMREYWETLEAIRQGVGGGSETASPGR